MSAKQSAEQLCTQVTKFLSAMRTLQKAVNRKEKDVSDPKFEFENSKKELETLVAKVKASLSHFSEL